MSQTKIDRTILIAHVYEALMQMNGKRDAQQISHWLINNVPQVYAQYNYTLVDGNSHRHNLLQGVRYCLRVLLERGAVQRDSRVGPKSHMYWVGAA